MNTAWKVLPRDVLYHILEYDGRIKYINYCIIFFSFVLSVYMVYNCLF